MAYAYLDQPVIASALCFQRDADSFFSPEALGHTGYAANGSYYNDGVVTGNPVASWFSEAQSDTRGPSAVFPQQVLVIVSRTSIALVDATSEDLNLWMLFIFSDTFAYADNAQLADAGYVASAVTWNNGLLSVTMSPDAGSTPQAIVVLTFDFTLDATYADTNI